MEPILSWENLAAQVCNGASLTRPQAQSILDCPDSEILSLIHGAYAIRQKFFGRRVKLNFLLNAKSGLCPEDCSYCSQSKAAKSGVEQYPFLSKDEILQAAGRAVETKAKRFCMVNSGRGPTDGEVSQIAGAVKEVRSQYPQLEVCVCLGLLKEDQAKTLKESGVHAYNHNLNTSESHYSKICGTHNYQDREETIAVARAAGMSSCSGCLFGLGEQNDDRIDLAFRLKELQAESIPINFLMAIAGTTLKPQEKLSPQQCIKILAMFRFVNPSASLRIAGGREHHLRWLQPLGLYIANSIFIGDYLTTKGQKPQSDLEMIRDLGFEIEGAEMGAEMDTELHTKSDTESDTKSTEISENFSVQLK